MYKYIYNIYVPCLKSCALFTSLSLLVLFPYKATAQTATEDALMNIAIQGSIWTTVGSILWGKNPFIEGLHLTKQIGVGLQKGDDNSISMSQIQVIRPYKNIIYSAQKWNLTAHWEFDIASWDSKLYKPQNKSGYFFGITPVFNYTWQTTSIQPYLELGAGVKYLSSIHIENLYKSTQFQFGDIFGIGIGNGKYQLGYRYLHISNANIELPNPGNNFQTLHFSYIF